MQMALWLVRGGRHGEHEERFFETGQIFLTWGEKIKDNNLENIKSFDAMRAFATETYPEKSPGWIGQTTSQFWSFVSRMQKADLVATPRKGKSAIAIGTITGPYIYDSKAPPNFRHSRTVKWHVLDAPRAGFEQDLLYSLGAYTTICEIKRNDAEARVRDKLKHGFKLGSAPLVVQDADDNVGEAESSVDITRLARDQIAQLLERQFKGHAMARLVGAILEAEGYTTRVSPEGTDKGIDILAAPGSLGFGHPRICVQVKSGTDPVDRPTLDQLLGAMSNVDADQGLLVSWGGFKNTVEREASTQYFRVRLWDADALVENLLAHYDKLSDEVRAEIPLQRIWTLVMSESDD
jgi:restriction system protein